VTCATDDHWASRQKGATKTPSERKAEEDAAAAAKAGLTARFAALMYSQSTCN
jgi:hypothetical protein